MPLLVAVVCWALGVIINRLADGLPHGKALGRPRCQACTAPRPPAAWSALLALLAGRRRCAYCGVSQSPRGAWVETAAAAAGIWLGLRPADAFHLWAGVAVLAWFLLIVVIDVEHRLIPHRVTFPAALVIGLLGMFDPIRGPVKTLLGGAVGLALFFLLYLLGGLFARLVTRIRRRPLDEIAFGFGDVTLAGVIGLAVGWPGVIVALFLGILAAGAFSLGYLLLMMVRRRYTAFVAIPYGPFMILGALVVYFGGRTALERLLGG